MVKRRKGARSSAGTSPERTDAVLSRTDLSITNTSASDGAVACPWPTPTEKLSSEGERADNVLQVLGGCLSRQFISSDCIVLLLIDLKRLGFEREAELLAQGFTLNRTRKIHDFMG